MEINTRDYGVVEIDEASVIHFDFGIIGFDEYRDYALLDVSDGDSPFKCLQSVDESSLAFILLDPFAVKRDYEISLDDDIIERLRLDNAEDVAILAITVVPQDMTKMTFNLKAPLIINADIRKGEQYIVDNARYSVRHSVLAEMENTRKAADRNGSGTDGCGNGSGTGASKSDKAAPGGASGAMGAGGAVC